jgi:hypothetical protein
VTISEIKTKLVGAGSLLPRTAPVIFLNYNNGKHLRGFDILIIPL